MIICFTADAGAKIALDNLLNSRMYKDASEAICVSLINHDIIQREAQHNGTLQITRVDLSDDRSPFVQGSRRRGPHGPPRLRGPDAQSTKGGGGHLSVGVPEIFNIPQTKPSPDEFPPIAETTDADEVTGPRQWLFGQYNKLLPVKATLRALLNLSGSNSQGIPLDEAMRTISTEAWLLGDYLDSVDEERGKRETLLATAFPTTRGSGSPGQSRFANQFVLSVNAEGRATGLPIALRMIAYASGKTPRVNLTKQGATFALLENPVLDQPTDSSESKFSPDEVSFLINHIRTYVPEERSAFKIVLNALLEGATTPKGLDGFLTRNYRDSEITSAFMSLQRSGVISRLIDLELVRRVREGTRVTYTVTESGKELCGQLADIKT